MELNSLIEKFIVLVKDGKSYLLSNDDKNRLLSGYNEFKKIYDIYKIKNNFTLD